MWLLPPDFPADAFDLPPGTWALPWYADDPHIALLMRLLIAGEARIREWVPLPWAALADVEPDSEVRPGAALVLHAPAELEPDEIVAKARTLPWPYVLWCSPRPALEGEGAWLEREVKRSLLSELHRGLLDPGHPLARFHVDRLPLALVTAMVSDPVDLLEIAEAAILHRVEHARDGLRKQDFEYSARWTAGRHLGRYLLRIPEGQRDVAAAIIHRGGRGDEDRASFRQTAQAIQDVGLGLFVGEDLALGPLARSVRDEVVWAGVQHELPTRLRQSMEVVLGENAGPMRLGPARVVLPSLELLPPGSSKRFGWAFQLVPPASEPSWIHAALALTRACAFPRGVMDISGLAEIRRLLTTTSTRIHRYQRIQELLILLIDAVDPSRDIDLTLSRKRLAALVESIAIDDEERAMLGAIDLILIEHTLLHRPNPTVLEILEHEATARAYVPPGSWIDATWASISAEVARLGGRATLALARFDEASHRWAALELDGRSGWLQSRLSAACAAFEAMQLARATRTIDLVANPLEQGTHGSAYAMISLLRGLIAGRHDASAAADSLRIAAQHFATNNDERGHRFAQTALAEHQILAGDLGQVEAVRHARDEFHRLGDLRGVTYTDLVRGDAAQLGSNLDEARTCYADALRHTEQTGDDLARSTALHKLAHLEAGVHRYDVALGLEKQALQLEQKLELSPAAEATERKIAELDVLAASLPAEP
jgi:hypothetical protein